MIETVVVPQNLQDDIHALTRDLGLTTPEATVQYLLQNAVAKEKKLLVLRMYQNHQKTLRQCAELLHIDLEEMIDTMRDFRIPFNDDIDQQIETVKRLAQKIGPAKPRQNKRATNKPLTLHKKAAAIK